MITIIVSPLVAFFQGQSRRTAIIVSPLVGICQGQMTQASFRGQGATRNKETWYGPASLSSAQPPTTEAHARLQALPHRDWPSTHPHSRPQEGAD
ncbi:MAG: hypothetical protein [Circoviridae sp.]|nr:MAG: hypothetical protein [Circoviridae sp.]